ncbi:unnamed protein product [Penicillium pancosmium]
MQVLASESTATTLQIPSAFTTRGPSPYWVGIYSEGDKDGDICRVWSHVSSCSGPSEPVGKYDATGRKCVPFDDCGKSKSSFVRVCGEVGSLKVYYSDEDVSPAGSLEITYMWDQGDESEKSKYYFPMGVKPGCQSWSAVHSAQFWTEPRCGVDKARFHEVWKKFYKLPVEEWDRNNHFASMNSSIPTSSFAR